MPGPGLSREEYADELDGLSITEGKQAVKDLEKAFADTEDTYREAYDSRDTDAYKSALETRKEITQELEVAHRELRYLTAREEYKSLNQEIDTKAKFDIRGRKLLAAEVDRRTPYLDAMRDHAVESRSALENDGSVPFPLAFDFDAEKNVKEGKKTLDSLVKDHRKLKKRMDELGNKEKNLESQIEKLSGRITEHATNADSSEATPPHIQAMIDKKDALTEQKDKVSQELRSAQEQEVDVLKQHREVFKQLEKDQQSLLNHEVSKLAVAKKDLQKKEKELGRVREQADSLAKKASVASGRAQKKPTKDNIAKAKKRHAQSQRAKTVRSSPLSAVNSISPKSP